MHLPPQKARYSAANTAEDFVLLPKCLSAENAGTSDTPNPVMICFSFPFLEKTADKKSAGYSCCKAEDIRQILLGTKPFNKD